MPRRYAKWACMTCDAAALSAHDDVAVRKLEPMASMSRISFCVRPRSASQSYVVLGVNGGS